MDRILLFIPMYNCEKQIVRVLSQLTDNVCAYLTEVIIVNNRSTDDGESAVIDYLEKNDISVKVTLFRNDQNYGLGGSHKFAFDYAIKNEFDYIIVLHGDDQGSILDLIPLLENKTYFDYDCLLGARFMKGSKLKGYSKFRTFGNKVYNILFSLGCRQKIYDLGSGLNLYNVDLLKDRFYLKFKDNLMFNYCMIMASSYFKHKIKFFPLSWREDDQVSNVKMFNQAFVVLKLLFLFVLNRSRFLNTDFRMLGVSTYTAQVIYSNR